MRKILLVLFVIFSLGILYILLRTNSTTNKISLFPSPTVAPQNLNPLSIVAMRARSYPGSAITIDRQLSDGSNYHQYLTHYLSDGLKIYALLTVPIGEKPSDG